MDGADAMSAQDCKAKGNEFLKLKKYPEAIAWYTQAIEKDPAGHVYYSNRSAAHDKRQSQHNSQTWAGCETNSLPVCPVWPRNSS